MTKQIVRTLLAIAMIAMGILHFIKPEPFVHIVPTWLPAPLALVYISGVAELAGGLGLLWSRTRALAAWGLVLLYIAVFPANINMALHPELAPEAPVWGLWARLPLQIALVALAVWMTRVPKRTAN